METLVAGDIMQEKVRTVRPDTSLADLERTFLQERVTGFPVVEAGGRLVGLVSRSDVVRQLGLEQSLAETVSGFYQDLSGFEVEPRESFEETAARVGRRIEHLRVADVMVSNLITVGLTDPLREIARSMVRHRVHRVLVVEDGRLRGLISALDLVRLFAEGHARTV